MAKTLHFNSLVKRKFVKFPVWNLIIITSRIRTLQKRELFRGLSLSVKWNYWTALCDWGNSEKDMRSSLFIKAEIAPTWGIHKKYKTTKYLHEIFSMCSLWDMLSHCVLLFGAHFIEYVILKNISSDQCSRIPSKTVEKLKPLDVAPLVRWKLFEFFVWTLDNKAFKNKGFTYISFYLNVSFRKNLFWII